MTDNVLNYLKQNEGKCFRVLFDTGNSILCNFDGYCYDYDEDDNEVLELTFFDLKTKTYVDATPSEIVMIEAV